MAKKDDLFYADRITDGAFVTRPVRALLRELEGQQVEVCIRRRRNYTSGPQRGWYFGVIIWLIREEMRRLGVNGPHGGPITDEQVHQMMAQRFLRESVLINPETGEYLEVALSTTEITAGRMAEYCEEVRQWAHDTLGLSIPDPDPAWSLVAGQARK